MSFSRAIALSLAVVLPDPQPALSASSRAQSESSVRPSIHAKRTDIAPAVDGRLDDAVWSSAPLLGPLTQVEPVEGVAASERTDVRLLFDSDYLYIGIRCHDSQASEIIATTKERDGFFRADDRIELVLDTFDDSRSAYFFQMNSAGSKGDGLITQSGGEFNKPWDGIWQGRASVDAEGWSVEIALPFATLSFREDAGAWGFNVLRYIGRTRERVQWSEPRQDARFFDPSFSGRLLGLSGLRQGFGLDVVPFFVADWTNDHEAGDQDVLGDGGLDAFYRLSSELTLSMTVNTDFAETEVDERRINLTRFPLFFEERRDFFLESAGRFEFGSDGVIPFFSRTVGLDGAGLEVPILAGAKLSGRVGPWSVGLLDVQTDSTDLLGSKNLFAARVSHDLGKKSSIGGIVTQGNPSGDGDASTIGLDYNFRTNEFRGDKVLNASVWGLMNERDEYSDDQGAFGASISYPNDLWQASFSAREVQENFDPAMGFARRTGVRAYGGDVAYMPRPGTEIRQYEFSFSGDLVTDVDDDVETAEVEVQPIGVQWESGDAARLELEMTHDVLDEEFEIVDDVVIPAGRYDFGRIRAEYEASSKRPLRLSSSLSTGGFFDGDRDELEFDLDWRVGPTFVGEAEYEVNRIDLPGGSFTTHLARVGADVHFSPRTSWRNLVQWDSLSDSYGIQSRLRWIPEPGRELFVVFNETLVEDEDDSITPLFQGLAFKIAYTLRF